MKDFIDKALIDLRKHQVNINDRNTLDHLLLTMSLRNVIWFRNESKVNIDDPISYNGIVNIPLPFENFLLLLNKYILVIKRVKEEGKNLLRVNIIRFIDNKYEHYHIHFKIYNNSLVFINESSTINDEDDVEFIKEEIERIIIPKLVCAIDDYHTVQSMTVCEESIPKHKIHEMQDYNPDKIVTSCIELFTNQLTVRTKKPYLGGHHASPAIHERRGHWRHYKNGTVIWIEATHVGTRANGYSNPTYILE